MKNLLPYIALGLTLCVLLFGNDIIGSKHDKELLVGAQLAVISTQLANQKELSEKQYAKIQSIEKVQAGHSQELYMLGVDTRQLNRLLALDRSQNSDGPSNTPIKWHGSKRSGGQD